MTILPRIAETIDAELRRQNLASQWIGDLDPESIAVAVMNHIADALSAEGWQAPARWLRAGGGEQMTQTTDRELLADKPDAVLPPGCTCTMIEAGRRHGDLAFWINADCPLHGPKHEGVEA